MEAVEELQRFVWPGSEIDIVPAHVLLAASHNGGLVIGAYQPGDARENPSGESPAQPRRGDEKLVGFVFGFPGLYFTPDGPRPKHYSHMLGVHPDYRNQGIGFGLKRAQWQMVRHQGIDCITWTYDPLLSRNAYLNITRLGAVCSVYKRNEYGDMRDELNKGLPSDRFQVDWWVNTKRVERRLSNRPRLQLDLAHFLAAGAEIINPSDEGENGFPEPVEINISDWLDSHENIRKDQALLLLEIPSNYDKLRNANRTLAYAWRIHTRTILEGLFAAGYLVTDFIFLPGATPRSFYVLSHGESTL
jgi:predicted GNAT superfamily acetyltransferase